MIDKTNISGETMAFERRNRSTSVPEDPEALYRRLARTNDGPDGLWGHQIDLLRSWHTEFRTKSDVALELPTGAGKTMVGGLVGEWLRLSEGRPIAYLCPTRQLARQAAEALNSYGIKVVLLTGSSKDWDAASRAKFTAAHAIAVSTYSHVFNTNPALAHAGTLILDDAHAGEQFVAHAWSISILRTQAAYQTVLALLADGLDPAVAGGLRKDDSSRRYDSAVHLVSPTVVAANASALEKALDAAREGGDLDQDQAYGLTALSGHLGRCMIYLSHRSILIRPLISPTRSHAAFSDPPRRIYMSATLGAGGELERAFGREKIARMPVPRGWDKQGTGRRFFVFPELTSDVAQDKSRLGPWLSATISRHGRAALVTCARYVSDALLEKASLPKGYARLTGRQVEDDITIFTHNPTAILDLPNRYDGIDLPDEACRLVILAGLPAQADLQERFLYEALGAGAVLQERVRARIIQGAGRATRNIKDYATIVIVGSDLTDFVIRRDVLQALREELQAEITFGQHQSLDKPISQVDENIDLFLAQGQEWLEVERDITADREACARIDPPATSALAASAGAEVRATQAWWDGDLDTALTEARAVLDHLSSSPDALRYSALWHYLSASWIKEVARETGDPTGALATSVSSMRADARAAGRGTTWMLHLVNENDAPASPDGYDPLDRLAAGNLLQLLGSWSTRQEEQLEAAKTGLSQTAFRAYELGLQTLGKLAGATQTHTSGNAQAAPDSTWIFGKQLWVCWEAKSEADPASNIHAKKVREACGHLNYAAGKSEGQAPPAASFTCFTTPQTGIDPAARLVADENLYYVPHTEPLDLLLGLERAIRKSRRMGNAVDEATLLTALSQESALPSQWAAQFCARPLRLLGSDGETAEG